MFAQTARDLESDQIWKQARQRSRTKFKTLFKKGRTKLLEHGHLARQQEHGRADGGDRARHHREADRAQRKPNRVAPAQPAVRHRRGHVHDVIHCQAHHDGDPDAFNHTCNHAHLAHSSTDVAGSKSGVARRGAPSVQPRSCMAPRKTRTTLAMQALASAARTKARVTRTSVRHARKSESASESMPERYMTSCCSRTRQSCTHAYAHFAG